MKKHYMVLDSFRGICACIVAFSHFNANSIIYGSSLWDRGSPYVDFLYGELYAKLDYGFLRCVYGFSCGALTWFFFKKHHEKIGNYLTKSKKITLLEVSAIIAVGVYISYFSFDLGSFAAPLIYSGVILLFAFENGRVSKFLQAKTFLLLGTLSYSIYMIHLFISGKFFALPIRLLETKLGWNITVQSGEMQLYGTNLVYGTLLEIFYLFVVIGCSFISYKLIEEPFRNWTRQWVNKDKKSTKT